MKVHNVWLGVIIRFCQIAVVGYVLTYAIYLEKGYQVGGKAKELALGCVVLSENMRFPAWRVQKVKRTQFFTAYLHNLGTTF